MAKTGRRPLTGMGADAFFGESDVKQEEKPLDSETGTPAHSDTVAPAHSQTVDESSLIKTSFYPTQAQVDKLDDLAAAYNKKYRRQRPKINRNDIVRYLIDGCGLDTLELLHL